MGRQENTTKTAAELAAASLTGTLFGNRTPRIRATGLQQSLEGIKAIAGLGAGAVVIWVVYEFGGLLLPDAKAAAPGGFGGVVANEWISTGLDTMLPMLFLGLVFFGLVAQAILGRQYG